MFYKDYQHPNFLGKTATRQTNIFWESITAAFKILLLPVSLTQAAYTSFNIWRDSEEQIDKALTHSKQVTVKKSHLLFLSFVFIGTANANVVSECQSQDIHDDQPSSHCLSHCKFRPFEYQDIRSIETTPIVNQDHIASFIIAEPTKCQQIVNTIYRMIQHIPGIDYYLKIPFQHLSGFHLRILAQDEISTIKGNSDEYDGGFLASIKELTLVETENTNGYLIRHELRHAVINTAHQLVKGAYTKSAYLPKTTNDKSLEKLIMLGESRIERLKGQLIKEQTGELNLAQKKQLRVLKAQFQDIYQQFYQKSLKISSPNSQNSRNFAAEFNLRQTYRFQLSPIIFGDFQIQEFQFHENAIIMIYKINNVLDFIVNVPNIIKNSLKKYPKSCYEYEYDAHLFGHLPPQIIRFFYTELYAHIDSYLNHAITVASTQRRSPLYFNYYNARDVLSPIERVSLNNVVALVTTTSKKYPIEDAENFFNMCKHLIINSHVEAAKYGLHCLLEINSHIGPANLLLGRIEYASRRYQQALDQFNIAKKYNIQFDQFDNSKYQECSAEVSQLKKRRVKH